MGECKLTYSFVGIDHIQLAAPRGCEQEARAFFQELLGLEEIVKPEELKKRGGVWFQCGKHQIHVGVQDPFQPAKKAHPAFEVDNLLALKNHLNNHDMDVKEDDLLEGAIRFYLDDPFGNRLEFLQWVDK